MLIFLCFTISRWIDTGGCKDVRMPLDKDSILLTLGELAVPRIQIRPEVLGDPGCSCWCFSADWHSRFTPFLSPKAAWGLCTPNPPAESCPCSPWMCGMVMSSCFTSPGAIPAALGDRSPFLSFFTAFWIRALQCHWCCTRTRRSSKNCPKFSACSAKSLNLGKYQSV